MASRDWSNVDDDPNDRDGGNVRSGPRVTAKAKNKLDYEKTKSLPAKSRRQSVLGKRRSYALWGRGLTMDTHLTPKPPVGTRTFLNVHFRIPSPGHSMTAYESWLEKIMTVRQQFLNASPGDQSFKTKFEDYINVLRSVPAKIKLKINDDNIYQLPVFVDDDGQISINQDDMKTWKSMKQTWIPTTDGFELKI